MARDVVGNELYETDIVQVNLSTAKCIGVIKEIHRNRARQARGGKPAPRSGYMRVVAHFDIPFEDSEEILEGVAKVANPDHHKRIYGETQAEPVEALRVNQALVYDHKYEEETVNVLPR